VQVIIECFGLPGAGKTTIARGLAARLSIEEIWLDGRRDLIALNLEALLRHPVKYGRRTARAFHEPAGRRLQYYKLRHIFLYRNAIVEKARHRAVVIVDEGQVSNILSAFERPLSESRTISELGHLELPDLVLRVTAPDEERARRLDARGYFSRSSEGEDYLRRWELAMRANEAMVARVLPGLGVPCVPVDDRSSIDDVYSDVLEAMSEAGVLAERTSRPGDDHAPSASTSKP
jgi:broad-specificity NMP kinase